MRVQALREDEENDVLLDPLGRGPRFTPSSTVAERRRRELEQTPIRELLEYDEREVLPAFRTPCFTSLSSSFSQHKTRLLQSVGRASSSSFKNGSGDLGAPEDVRAFCLLAKAFGVLRAGVGQIEARELKLRRAQTYFKFKRLLACFTQWTLFVEEKGQERRFSYRLSLDLGAAM